MSGSAASTRLVKKVVVAYDLHALPASLMQSFILLRAKLARAGFKIEVGLSPLSRLPPDIDVLFVPAGLVEAARRAAPEVQVIAMTASTAQQPAYNEFVEQLQAGREMTAQRAEDAPDPVGSRGGKIVRYRGNRRVG
ncbi:MAG: hypothetical protein ACE5H9_17850 [Anaerolineae bacterium]